MADYIPGEVVENDGSVGRLPAGIPRGPAIKRKAQDTGQGTSTEIINDALGIGRDSDDSEAIGD